MLSGEAGNDTLDGAGGDDTLKGGAGNDVYLVDSFDDVVEDGVGGGKDTIRATSSYQLSDGQEIESLIVDSTLSPLRSATSSGTAIAMATSSPWSAPARWTVMATAWAVTTR